MFPPIIRGHNFYIIAVYVLVFLVSGAIMFTIFEEDWDLELSVYYCAMTATTIGFGDYYPTVALNGSVGVFKALAAVLYIVFSKFPITSPYMFLSKELVHRNLIDISPNEMVTVN